MNVAEQDTTYFVVATIIRMCSALLPAVQIFFKSHCHIMTWDFYIQTRSARTFMLVCLKPHADRRRGLSFGTELLLVIVHEQPLEWWWDSARKPVRYLFIKKKKMLVFKITSPHSPTHSLNHFLTHHFNLLSNNSEHISRDWLEFFRRKDVEQKWLRDLHFATNQKFHVTMT